MTYILDDWGAAGEEEVKMWENLLKTGVPDNSGTPQAPCPYNDNCLVWSRKLIVNSISVKLWEEIEKDLTYNISSPRVFVAIIDH